MQQGVWTSACDNSGGSCVEVMSTGTSFLVRDSKDLSKDPHEYTRVEWQDFIGAVKAGKFD